jgi:PIN domain nuclease of toxin-antitoxin system
VNLLLDTHTLLWLMEGNPKLNGTVAALIADLSNRLFLSMASLWELAIEVGLKKIILSVPYSTFVTTAESGYGLIVLPITNDNCGFYEALPFPDPQHRDPFDRMIITHALRNKLSVVGVDAAFDPYGVTPLW